MVNEAFGERFFITASIRVPLSHVDSGRPVGLLAWTATPSWRADSFAAWWAHSRVMLLFIVEGDIGVRKIFYR